MTAIVLQLLLRLAICKFLWSNGIDKSLVLVEFPLKSVKYHEFVNSGSTSSMAIYMSQSAQQQQVCMHVKLL